MKEPVIPSLTQNLTKTSVIPAKAGIQMRFVGCSVLTTPFCLGRRLVCMVEIASSYLLAMTKGIRSVGWISVAHPPHLHPFRLDQNPQSFCAQSQNLLIHWKNTFISFPRSCVGTIECFCLLFTRFCNSATLRAK